jgi:hypothetical protein
VGNDFHESPRRLSLFLYKDLSSVPLRALFDHERCKIEMFLQDIRSTTRASASRRQLKVEEIPPEILRLDKDTLAIKLHLTFRYFSERVRRYTLSGRL